MWLRKLHGVLLDERLAVRIVEDAMGLKNTLLIDARDTVSDVDRGGEYFRQSNLSFKLHRPPEFRANRSLLSCERRRLKPKERNAMSVVHHSERMRPR